MRGMNGVREHSIVISSDVVQGTGVLIRLRSLQGTTQAVHPPQFFRR